MEIITSLEQQVAAARHLLDGVPAGESLPGFLQSLPDDGVLAVLKIGAALVRLGQRLEIPASGVVAQRSTRRRGKTGIAQSQGHRDAAALVQQLTGVSRSQAARDVRVGQSLVEAAEASQLGSASSGGVKGWVEGGDWGGALGVGVREGEVSEGGIDEGFVLSADPSGKAPSAAWHTVLDRAADAGTISPDQFTAIRQGLSDPPVPTHDDIAAVIAASVTTDLTDTSAPNTPPLSEIEAFQRVATALRQTWAMAAGRLLEEAHQRSLDELRKACRAVRDELDPAGSRQRYQNRYLARSFHMWVDDTGQHKALLVLDDESAAWIRSVIDSAMRPRRGGPRFISAEEEAAAQQLREDPRTNTQLTHDLIIDVLRGGTLAKAAEVFGVRQPGVRMVHVVDPPDAHSPSANQPRTDQPGANHRGANHRGTDQPGTDHAFLEHEGTPIPVAVTERNVCNTGVVPVTVDRQGNPLYVGREQRLFTAKQRIALSLRDGGCRWRHCDRPATYCEAHHIDEWKKDHGHTNLDRGILLCRYHHLELHNSGWRITREGEGPFFLHRPDSTGTSTRTDTSASTSVSTGVSTGVSTWNAPGGSSVETQAPPDEPVELPIRVIRSYSWGSAPNPSVRFRPHSSAPPQQVPPEVWGMPRPSPQSAGMRPSPPT